MTLETNHINSARWEPGRNPEAFQDFTSKIRENHPDDPQSDGKKWKAMERNGMTWKGMERNEKKWKWKKWKEMERVGNDWKEITYSK